MKIALVTVNDIQNKSSWKKELQGLSAAGHYIGQYLSDESSVVNYISPLHKKFTWLTKPKWLLYRYILKKDYYRWAEPLISRNYAHQISAKLDRINYDVVLCPENIVPIAYLNCKQPIVLWTDATLASLINFYRHMNNLCYENIQNLYKMEASALHRCKLLIYTSEWAAQTAIHTYGINPEKIKVVPFGANLEYQRTWNDIQEIVRARDKKVCQLLFIGVDWIRKGGDTALAVVERLNGIGLKAELIIVGCIPPIHKEALPEFAKVVGFVDKSLPEGTEKINQLFIESHFLILPTLADCTPQVFNEANSFAVPVLSTDVGGINTLIQDGLNGKTFHVNASVSEYGDYIVKLMTDYSSYENLAYSSFEQYESRLNWQVSIGSVKKLVQELIN
jgi:glycosyltransferase involved in cell wall biosynthesis